MARCGYRRCGRRRGDAAGFTLIELMVVAAVLVAVAVIGVQAIFGTADVAEERLVLQEMRRVAEAIGQFRSDTNFYPKQGPFSTASVPTGTGPLGSPANMIQLFRSPEDTGGDDIMPWNADTGRGWRGPYLGDFGEGTVTVGTNFVSSDQGPFDGTATRVSAVADPFEAAPQGTYFAWQEPISGRDVEQRGAPYLLFLDAAAGTTGTPGNITGCVRPCLLSLGPNGDYEAGGGDDLVLNLTPPL